MNKSISAEVALERLKEGNQHYIDGEVQKFDSKAGENPDLTKAQNPFAAILGCADSRVPPSLIFDQGPGNLFVVRVAGNTAGLVTIGSLEFAVANLGVRLIVVMGHQNCGAVDAAIDGDIEGNLDSIIAPLRPAIEKAKSLSGDLLENATRLNATLTAAQLSRTPPILSKHAELDGLVIKPAYYEIDSGTVTFLD